MRSPTLKLLPCLLVLVAALAAPAAAGAESTDYCRPHARSGPICTVWEGKVVSVNDGDTMDVDVWGDGTRRPVRVRFGGINATELTSYASSSRAGECHAVDATERLEQLVRDSKRRVRLAAENPERRSRNRLVRWVAVKPGRRWQDVGRLLVKEGHALWFPGLGNATWNRTYSILSQRAAVAALNMFDVDRCGPGPAEASPLRLDVNWDADGRDRDDPNGEWVRIRNLDPVNAVTLDGWWLRDSSLRRYIFPFGTSIAPGGEVTVFAGEGASGGVDYFWGERRPIFENVTRGDKAKGDGAYLFDPQGDLRAWMMYPCREGCAAPYAGQIALRVKERGKREWIEVINHTGTAVSLHDFVLKTRPHVYAFGPDAVLQAGESLKVMVKGHAERDTSLRKHWGKSHTILNDGGDSVSLRTFDDRVVTCGAWGTGSC